MKTRSERQHELQTLFDIGGRSAGTVVERFVEVCPEGRMTERLGLDWSLSSFGSGSV